MAGRQVEESAMKIISKSFISRLSTIGLLAIGLLIFQFGVEGWATISPTNLPDSERLISKDQNEKEATVTILKPASSSRVYESLNLSPDQGKKALGLLLLVLSAAAEEST